MPDFVRRIPDGDSHERLVCADCGHVAYENPKVVTGAVVEHLGNALLCRRAIEPRSGYWTLPAGYLELGETPEEGARREAAEEACAAIELEGILGVFSVSRIGQVQIFYRARFTDPSLATLHCAGDETLETRLFAWDDLPWTELAFPTVRWALEAWYGSQGQALGAPAGNPAEDRPGVKERGVKERGVEGRDVEGRDVEGRDVEGRDVEGRDVEGRDVEGLGAKAQPKGA